ncbi:hypothetical protein K8I61_06810 [bacterium]|nr:hypothetical protein [bacterium]
MAAIRAIENASLALGRMIFLAAAFTFCTAPALADQDGEGGESDVFELAFHGYGEIHFSYMDFGPNQNREGGAQKDERLVFDQTRFVFEIEGEIEEADIEFEAEIEFEHGGTGAAMELEYEEFGEYESEVEKGGEVVVEELFVKKEFFDAAWLKAGRFYVAMGLLSDFHLPNQFLATRRAEAESTILPATWDEMGAEGGGRYRWITLTGQVVNGLDSTGFSSQRWVASGHQTRFEEVRATDLAYVGRLDIRPLDDARLLVGGSVYYGGTSRNRSKPDLVKRCDAANDDEVAPCGYVEAPVTIVDGHLRFDFWNVRGQAAYILGRLEKADEISERNARLSNALDVRRTPVADEARAAWFEIGVDVMPYLGASDRHALEPFFHYDTYDTMAATDEAFFDNPRFEREVFTAGLSYLYRDAVFVKADGALRTFGSDELREERTATLATGFVF